MACALCKAEETLYAIAEADYDDYGSQVAELCAGCVERLIPGTSERREKKEAAAAARAVERSDPVATAKYRALVERIERQYESRAKRIARERAGASNGA
jgi:hypothetical protein